MDLLSGLPRAARPTWHEGTREQIQMSFFNDLITAESHYLTTDSEIMQRREVPSAYYLMLSFPQACIFVYLMSEDSIGSLSVYASGISLRKQNGTREIPRILQTTYSSSRMS